MSDRTVTIEETAENNRLLRPAFLTLALHAGNLDAPTVRIPLAGIQEVHIGRGEFDVVKSIIDGKQMLHITVDDNRMSRRHATLCASGSAFEFCDAGSKNGCFVDGRPVFANPLPVDDGALLEMGQTFFVLRRRYAASVGSAQTSVYQSVLHVDGVRSLSPQMAQLLEQAVSIAPSSVPVFLHGATGTGKEVIARLLHRQSGRKGAFVGVNAAALPNELIASELFGATKGAFSGADRARVGFIRSAEGGTLFLDEIADLSLAAQATVLRALQEREVTPVGATKGIPVDFRLVTATNQDLDAAVATGSFRADLLARINGLKLNLPPLQDRIEDMALLLVTFLSRLQLSAVDVKLSLSMARTLMLHAFPYNVRELEQGFIAAVELARARNPARPLVIDAITLSPASTTASAPRPPKQTSAPEELPTKDIDDDNPLRVEVERQLREHNGNISAVASAMGKQRNQVYRWVQRFGLRPQDYR